MKNILLTTYYLFFSSILCAQVKIAANTSINSSKDAVITSGMSINNDAEGVVLPTVNLLNAGTTITTAHDLQIIGGMEFSSGMITFNGNIFYSGGGDNLFYDGNNYLLNTSWDKFHVVGNGFQKYPIGTSTELTDAFMNLGSSISDTTQVEVVPINPGLDLSTLPSVKQSSSNWYWRLYGNDAKVVPTLSVNSPDDMLLNPSNPNEALVVLAFDEGASTITNLSRGTGSTGEYIKAANAAAGPNFTLGVSIEVVPAIHQIISPNRDGDNDVLEIENLDVYAENYEVILIDRLGAVVWRSKRLHEGNTDFEFLEPGNYICLLKYGGGKELKQMVTVLK